MSYNKNIEVLLELENLKMVQSRCNALTILHKKDNGYIFGIGYHESALQFCNAWGDCDDCGSNFTNELRHLFTIAKLMIPKQ
jgi:hypothetical protein